MCAVHTKVNVTSVKPDIILFMHRGQINTNKQKRNKTKQVNRHVPHHLPCDLPKTSTNPGTLIILAKSFMLALLVLAVIVFLFPPFALYLLYFPVYSEPVCVVRRAVLLVFAVSQYGLLGAVSVAVLLGFAFITDGEPLALDVRLDPEVGEEDEEEHAVHPDEVDK